MVWALSRIGARELLYGPVDRVVPPVEAAGWIHRLLDIQPRNPAPVGNALMQMARKTGDRVRDMDPDTIERIADWLERNRMADKIRLLTTVVPLAPQEETLMFGEELPYGIVLKA
jgi:hypothetical protein